MYAVPFADAQFDCVQVILPGMASLPGPCRLPVPHQDALHSKQRCTISLVASPTPPFPPKTEQEMRVKGTYVHHKEVRAAMGIKLAAHNLETAVAGTQVRQGARRYLLVPGSREGRARHPLWCGGKLGGVPGAQCKVHAPRGQL